MKYLITGGGTGGHLYPALEIMRNLHEMDENDQVYYVGTDRGIEQQIIPNFPWIEFRKITVRGLSRNNKWDRTKAWVLLPLAMMQSLKHIFSIRPDIIYGTGSYLTFPLAFWATVFKIPLAIQELNVLPGLANKILAPYADSLILSYGKTKKYLPKAKSPYVAGTPVRKEITDPKNPAGENLGLDPSKKTVSLLGGTLGSKGLSEKIIEDLKEAEIKTELQIVVQTGEKNYTQIKDLASTLKDKIDITIVDYIEDMASVYALSDLLICRGGAGTMSELIATKTPAFIVPWSDSSEGHQFRNASYLERKGAAIVIPEYQLDSINLIREVQEILCKPKKLKKMREAYGKIESIKSPRDIAKHIKKLNDKEKKNAYRTIK